MFQSSLVEMCPFSIEEKKLKYTQKDGQATYQKRPEMLT